VLQTWSDGDLIIAHNWPPTAAATGTASAGEEIDDDTGWTGRSMIPGRAAPAVLQSPG